MLTGRNSVVCGIANDRFQEIRVRTEKKHATAGIIYHQQESCDAEILNYRITEQLVIISEPPCQCLGFETVFCVRCSDNVESQSTPPLPPPRPRYHKILFIGIVTCEI
jgi:hypothetical protein